jgi:hypothetical protein
MSIVNQPCQRQLDAVSCGDFSIANFYLASKNIHPSEYFKQWQLKACKIRSHLIDCFRQARFDDFPSGILQLQLVLFSHAAVVAIRNTSTGNSR